MIAHHLRLNMAYMNISLRQLKHLEKLIPKGSWKVFRINRFIVKSSFANEIAIFFKLDYLFNK